MSSANAWMQYHVRHQGQILATQSRARALTADEAILADALEQSFAAGIHDFTEIAARLTQQAIPVPASVPASAPGDASGQTLNQWTPELLASVLSTINTELDSAYAKDGFGA